MSFKMILLALPLAWTALLAAPAQAEPAVAPAPPASAAPTAKPDATAAKKATKDEDEDDDDAEAILNTVLPALIKALTDDDKKDVDKKDDRPKP